MKFVRRLVTAAVVSGGVVVFVAAVGSTAWASGSPAPSVPSAPSPAAGFQTTVLSETVAPSTTAQTFTAVSNGADIAVTVPPGAFGDVVVDLVLTEPALSSLTSSLSQVGLAGYSLGAGVGVEVVTQSTGQPLSGNFASPLSVSIVSSSITTSSKVIEYPTTGSPYVVNNAVVSGGKVAVSVSSDPGFAVATPVSTTVPGATAPVTGKNFLPEGIVAGLLLVSGVSFLAVGRRRRTA